MQPVARVTKYSKIQKTRDIYRIDISAFSTDTWFKKMKTERGERFDTCLMETVNKMQKIDLAKPPPQCLDISYIYDTK